MPPIPSHSLPTQQPVTVSSLASALSVRLGVPSNPFWTAAELQLYVVEALRTWNSLARYWRTQTSVATTAGYLFYDLSATSPASSVLGYSVKDTDLITAMEYHLLEPPTPASWTGSEMFTLADFTAALEARRDQFLLETGCVISQYSFPIPSPPANGRITLADAVIDVRRAVYQDAAGNYHQLSRADEWELDSFLTGWATPALAARSYSVSVTPPFGLQLAPPPTNPLTLQLLVVGCGAQLNPAAGVVLGVPDDFAWAVKWGALADLLGKDGEDRDPARAAYCEQRYEEGVAAARLGVSVMTANVNGSPIRTESLYDFDYFNPTWHNQTGQPNRIGMAGLNLLAVNKLPDRAYTLTLDVIQNAPIANTTAPLFLSQSMVDVLIDYAEHLAAFKMGGAEFEATQPHYQRLNRLAAINNERLLAAAPFAATLENREQREERERWRRVPAAQAS